MPARAFGLLLIAIGAVAGWIGLWLPVQAARAGAETIEYGAAGMVLAPFATVFGLHFLIFGTSVPYRDVARQRPTRAGWVLMIAAALASAGAFWWLRAQVGPLGYWASGMPRERVGPFVPTPIPTFTPPAPPPDFRAPIRRGD